MDYSTGDGRTHRWRDHLHLNVIVADLPKMNGAMGRFMLTTMASVAELEAGLVSERTKAALKAAKARGVKLGRHGSEVLAHKYQEEARQRARQLEPIISELKDNGLSLAKIAAELNRLKVATPRCRRWDHSSVRNVLSRLAVTNGTTRSRTARQHEPLIQVPKGILVV